MPAERRRRRRNASGTEHVPRYTIPETARYLHISKHTLASWIRGRWYPVADHQRFWDGLIDRPVKNDPRLSFSNLLEAYVLNALRKQFRVPIPRVRKAIIETGKHYGIKDLLRSDALRVTERNVYVDHLGKLICVGVGYGQQAMPEVLNAYLRRIKRSASGFPISLAPVTREEPASSPELVLIHPDIAFGRPVVESKAIRTAAISERFQLGESVSQLSEDYDLTTEEVEEAIRYERPILAA